MTLFLSETERARIVATRAVAPVRDFYWALLTRVETRAATPGLLGPDTTCEWWHCAAEYLTDAAMAHALRPSPPVAAWLRAAVLELVRRPPGDWIGPAFRDHTCQPPQGNLETAHLTWSLAVARDLAADLFYDAERVELDAALRRGLELCQRWLDAHDHVSNWRCVLNAGVAVAAAVLDEPAALASAAAEYRRTVDFFQPDGSFGESLQYGNYAACALVLAREALIRRRPEDTGTLPLQPWIGKVRWDALALLHVKPLPGWPGAARARSVNFGDSAAIYRPSADWLLCVATRGREAHPREAGLARDLFDRLYQVEPTQGPHDRASFGFVNDFGFLSLLFLPDAASALTPAAAGLARVATVTAGDAFLRDAWGGHTILAVRTGGAPLHSVAHLHGDLLSGVLTHRGERLLADAGHSCYRNQSRELERATASHNTCTFDVREPDGAWRTLGQRLPAQRRIDRITGGNQPPITSPGRLLLAAESGVVRVVAAEAATAYGAPLQEFRRTWILAGANAVFVVDRIVSTEPVRTTWHWQLHNGGGALNLKLVQPDRLVVRRGAAGMKLFHGGGGVLHVPTHTRMHDAYHPLPGGPGEGAAGSGTLMRWTEPVARVARTVIHAICLDEVSAIAGWHYHALPDGAELEGPGKTMCWRVTCNESAQRLVVAETVTGQVAVLAGETDGGWSLK